MGVRLVVADRNVLIRDLLRYVCGERGVRVVGETTRTTELIALCREERPDVVVTDAVLDDGPTEPHLETLLESECRVIILCDDASPEHLTSLLARGASGYLLQDTAPTQVADAVVAVAGGAAALHPTAAHTILQQWRRLRLDPSPSGRRVKLTRRENDVLAAMADGLAAKAIARRLGVAVKTVENHKIRVFDKLGVRTQAEAVSLAIGHGLLGKELLAAHD